MFRFNKTCLTLGFTLLFGIPVQAQSFECPVPQVSAAQAAMVHKLLPLAEDFTTPSKLAPAIDALKNDHDGIVQVVNELIAAYCPLIAAQKDMSDAQKSAEVRKFGLNVTRQAFSLSSEEAVILDVELAPEVVEKINTLAKADNMSPQDWVAGQITTIIAK